ncbi:MAG: hypothetical protein N0E48_20020 [Candidatus Thiodiazotropha endolucinida]|nr:hypothetical protein [Candidatus Thiodiazotropha taylori]MCW4345622.1 hypothetical protein [Candidatus Thiodiazotropha endolucinida]
MKEHVLITVKTYPTISRSYIELVCTAGLRKDGSWIRIYPVQFRQWNSQYKKFQWIEVDLIENKSDRRIESHKLISPDSVKLLDTIGTSSEWQERKQYVLERGDVYYDLDHLIHLNKDGQLSLATFKPKKIIDMIAEEVDRDWDSEKIRILKEKSKQGDLFSDTPEYFKVADKLPYKFSYKFSDEKGKVSTMMIEDWEIGALYWNCLKQHKDNEEKAIEDIRKKYFDDFALKRDLYLFLGTTLKYDGWAQNPFVIIEVFAPPIKLQQELF